MICTVTIVHSFLFYLVSKVLMHMPLKIGPNKILSRVKQVLNDIEQNTYSIEGSDTTHADNLPSASYHIKYML